MSDRDPEPKNPLSPYYPSEVPNVPGDGRTWFAVLAVFTLLLGAVYAFLTLFLPP
ncbi:hypothetical protein [Haloplanus aerogenes]|uniref:Uncharacterized protein n=1 Tax=Haloplanus aerogenes TaxID=660522 RepID=A0A3M0CVF6_9EURY|nr:hypothetical protein [Haloplanus aerogenes]RMB12885.1 hypothetical protein ATH50_3041 [Haloplanus aerogenes]